jgi:hypothetical protein
MITNATAQAANDIRDIKPPIEISNGWIWSWWALAIVVAPVILFLILRWWKKRKLYVSLPPPIPAHLRAKQKLQEALALISQPKEFCTLVSDTIRFYLEERFEFRAPERTTEEFLHELQATDLLLPEQKESLGQFLESCDLVKFAKYEPGENELQGLHGSAFRLVEETEPEILQQPFQSNESSTETVEQIQSATREISKGKALAIIGMLLQLGPSAWFVSYIVMLLRLLFLAKNVFHSFLNPNAILDFYSKIFSIYGDALILICIGLFAGVLGIILLIISLVSLRFRAEWFFWFLMIYGFVLLWPFFCTTPIGIFFIVYCLTKRHEFFNRT